MCTTDLLLTAVNKAEWRGYGERRGGVEGAAYPSSGSHPYLNQSLVLIRWLITWSSYSFEVESGESMVHIASIQTLLRRLAPSR